MNSLVCLPNSTYLHRHTDDAHHKMHTNKCINFEVNYRMQYLIYKCAHSYVSEQDSIGNTILYIYVSNVKYLVFIKYANSYLKLVPTSSR